MTDTYDGTVTMPRPYNGTVTHEDPNLVVSWDLDEQTRAYILRDTDAPAPDWDGIGYVFRVYYRSSWGMDVLVSGDYGDTGARDVGDAIAAVWHESRDWEHGGRYLREFHDVVDYDYDTSVDRDGTVVAAVTRDQATAWGLEDPAGTAAGALDVYRQYAEGDVYGVIVVNTVTGDQDSLWEIYDSSPGLDYVRTVAADIAPIGVAS